MDEDAIGGLFLLGMVIFVCWLIFSPNNNEKNSECIKAKIEALTEDNNTIYTDVKICTKDHKTYNLKGR